MSTPICTCVYIRMCLLYYVFNLQQGHKALGLKRFKVFNSIQYDSIFIKKVSIRFKSIRFLHCFFPSTKFIQKFLEIECFNILTTIKENFLFYYLQYYLN